MFLDETGVLLTPLVRATWAPRGETPTLEQRMRHREKISVIGALCVSPDRRRVRLYLLFFPGDTVDAQVATFFLGQLLHHLRGPVALVWDGLGAHRGEEVEEFLDQHPRLRAHRFPPYWPELNPVEQVWRWLKWDELANFAPENVEALEAKAEEVIREAVNDQKLLRAFIALSELPLDLEPPRH